jgi:hypothetical protein
MGKGQGGPSEGGSLFGPGEFSPSVPSLLRAFHKIVFDGPGQCDGLVFLALIKKHFFSL